LVEKFDFSTINSRMHHVGITVSDVDRSLLFWKDFLDVEPRFHKVLDASYLSQITGYEGISLDACWIDLPGGVILEILNYLTTDKEPNSEWTANPGNVHICFETSDAQKLFDHAKKCGARPLSDGPVPVTEGPNRGSMGCYLRDPDGITLEILQPSTNKNN
jgi:catechol 2,3-dioxygenase-like lactoylglutathione lyase family enzyme|tara:strand:+ start:68 stop:550 length:483 start_codon:yes stop_codon:yes gene_type:complete